MFILIVLTVLTQGPVARTPSQAAPVIARLAGAWSGQGVVNTALVSAKAEFQLVLSKQFTRLTYAFSGAGVSFEGHASGGRAATIGRAWRLRDNIRTGAL